MSPKRSQPEKGEWQQVSMGLYTKQILFLDQFRLDIRSKSGVILERSAVIRAMVNVLEDAVKKKVIDPGMVEGEEELKKLVTSRLIPKRGGKR